MKRKHLIMAILAAFILIQPLIDVLTTATMQFSNSSITVGIVLRLVYMVVMAAWITYAAFHSKKAKLYFFYLTGLAVLVLVNFVLNYSMKNPYYLMEELSFYSKAIYFHVLFFGFLLVLDEIKKNGTDLKRQLINYFLVVSLIISAVFIISQLTGTSIQNYAHLKVGWSGWFSAGNVIGAIMTVLLPITALFAVSRVNKTKDVLQWIPFVLLSLSMLALGTKVGYGGIAITLLTVIIGSLIILIWKNTNHDKKKIKANLRISIGLLFLLLVVTPFTPVYGNMYTHFNLLGISFENKGPAGLGEDNLEGEQGEQNITGQQVENLIFSSREKYLSDYKRQFEETSNLQQLFGMGYSGNYKLDELGKPQYKMIEMDFHDWFFSFGIIGFIYIMIPIIWFVGKYLISFIVNFKSKFDYFQILTGVAFLLGIGIAYTAGHVFTAPQTSIYMSFLLATLIISDN